MMTDKREARIDEALEESFPASDPPSFIGAGAPPGAPPRRKRARGDWGQDFGSFAFTYPTRIFQARE
jgi:hypothetical protein